MYYTNFSKILITVYPNIDNVDEEYTQTKSLHDLGIFIENFETTDDLEDYIDEQLEKLYPDSTFSWSLHSLAG